MMRVNGDGNKQEEAIQAEGSNPVEPKLIQSQLILREELQSGMTKSDEEKID